MDEFWVDLGITAILRLLKTPAKLAGFKKAMLKVRNAINTAYATDEDFQ